jgi:4-hydroxybenzoate polyprenyltransferase
VSPRLLLASVRPQQWSKNFFVFAALVFGQRLDDPDAVLRAAATFAVFCALSGAMYLYNDVRDRDADRLHPTKRQRPLAAGTLSPGAAAGTAVVLAGGGIAAAWSLAPGVAAVAGAYVAILGLYSAGLKHVVIIDALAVAAGFVLRTLAGALAVGVPMSAWLFICTTLLALFIALSKRRHELTLLEGDASRHRRSLANYSPYLRDQMISVVGAATLVSYSVYATSPDTSARFGTSWLVLTIPFVLYGLLRYLYLIHQRDGGGSPDMILFTDRPLLASVAGWAAGVVAILYVGP